MFEVIMLFAFMYAAASQLLPDKRSDNGSTPQDGECDDRKGCTADLCRGSGQRSVNLDLTKRARYKHAYARAA